MKKISDGQPRDNIELAIRFEEMLANGQIGFEKEDDFFALIDYFEQDIMLDRALEVVDIALRKFEFLPEFHLKKAELLLKQKREEEALVALERAERLSPFDYEIGLLRSRVLVSMGLLEEALQLLDEMKAEAEAEILGDIYFHEALAFEALGAYERVFYALKAAVLENMDNEEALQKLWIVTEIVGKHKESLEFHKKITDERPYSFKAWHNLGAAYSYFGQYEEAIAAYEFSFLANESFEQGYRDCAELCFELKKYHKALSIYQDILRFDSDSALFLRIGQCHLKLGHPVVARTFFEKAVQKDPFNEEAFFYLGECYSKEGNWRKALEFYEEAVQLDDKREEFVAALAHCYNRLGFPDKAQPLFQAAAEIAPEQCEYWLEYASFFLEQEKAAEALEVLEEAEQYAVGVELFYCRIASLFILGKRDEAIYYLYDALEEDYEAHTCLLRWIPNLMDDPAVRNVLANYQHH